MKTKYDKIEFTQDEIEEIENCKTQDELFELWRRKQVEYEPNYKSNFDIEKYSFIADGIVEEKKFDNAPATVLFVLKEADIAKALRDGEIVEEPSKRTQVGWYKEDKNNKGETDNLVKQKEKMARMACYLLYGEKAPNENQLKMARLSLAFININKRGGGSSENKTITKYYFENYYQFIKRQLTLILDKTPKKIKYIVILNAPSAPYYGKFRELENDLKKKYGTSIKRIDMYHPSVRRQCRNVDKYMEEFFVRADKQLRD